MSFKNACMLLCAGIIGFAPAAYAAVKTSTVFNNHMVLQRETQVPVWGTADPGEEVTVTFAGQTVSGKADANGDWSVTLQPMKVNAAGSDMVIKGTNTITYKDILVGDVWLCGGQSNMEMTFRWGILDGAKFMEEAGKYPRIRHIKFTKVNAAFPLKNPYVSPWTVCSKENISGYTAAGYFFARRLVEETGIPIGILDNNWSGSKIENFLADAPFKTAFVPANKEEEQIKPWFDSIQKRVETFDMTNPESRKKMLKVIDSYREYAEKASAQVNAGKIPEEVPMTAITHPGNKIAWNAMMAPIVRFPITGAIWYQGCSNGVDGELYYYKQKALIESWRAAWKKDFPFYIVQLAAYTPATDDPAGGNGYARIREAQRRALTLPKTGLACAIDIGMERDIHPKNKQDVGERLALWALRDLYGKKDLEVSGPLFKSMKVEGNAVRISFDHAKGLCTADKKGYAAPVPTPGTAPRHFAVAGADNVWHWADAKIDGEEIVLTSKNVAAPVAVRYAYRAYPAGVNVYNAAGLPMVPFYEKVK